MRGMLFVSFGTSHEETRKKTLDAIERKLCDTFTDCVHYSAWTSPRIIEKVRNERGEHHDTVEEALARMKEDGVNDLVVSTTCVMNGREMTKIVETVEDWSEACKCPVWIADPLLALADDRAAVARAVRDEFASLGDGDALLLMGHGSSLASDGVYPQIEERLHAMGCGRFFVATIDGECTFEDAWPKIEACGAQRVYLAPLMIVAGDHAINDLAGDGEDSWASKLTARGVEAVPVLKGLGEYPAIQQLVCDHVEQALMVREVQLRG